MLLEFLPLVYHQAISWLPPRISHLFPQCSSWGSPLFLQLGCFGLDCVLHITSTPS